MVGVPSKREVRIWLQTDAESKVHIEYQEGKQGSVSKTSTYETKPYKSNTVKLTLSGLEPGRKYFYKVFINGKDVGLDSLSFSTAPLWQFNRGPVPEFTVAMGSCHFSNDEKYDRPGKPYGMGVSIFDAIREKKPDLMLWLGDNIYLREVDYDSRSGIYSRYSHTRAQEYLNKFLRTSMHMAIWDDHDYGPNDSDRSYFLKQQSREAFMDFWPNPSFGLPDYPNEGITTFFDYGDVDFFLLDNRWWRSPKGLNDPSSEMLGAKQLQWLMDALKNSKANFKIICVGSQIINPNTKFENLAGFETEYNKLLQMIAKNDIKGVLFVTGDRHFSEISKLEREGKYPLYDITTSPLTSTPLGFEEKNKLRVEGSFINQQNFSLFTFSGIGKERKLTITFHNENGDVLYTYIIQASDLK